MEAHRTVGWTRDAGFQLGVRKTLPIPHEQAWRLVISPAGIALWLGAGSDVRLVQGAGYQLADGARGEVRIYAPGSHVRLTWQPKAWPRESTIQVRVIPGNDRRTAAVIAFHQEHLPSAEARQARRTHFKEALASLARLAARGA